jgi:hypothetical protein
MTNESHRLLTRRQALAALAGGGAALLLAACGDDSDDTATPVAPPSTTSAGEQAPQSQPSTNQGSLTWRRLAPSGNGPVVRKDHSLAYDAEAGIAYVFGGRAASGGVFNDLWALDLRSNVWNRVDTAGGPPARFGHNAIFDSPRRRLIVFGGQAGSTFYNDVWAFSRDDGWRQLTPQMGPAPRYGAGGALDAASGVFYVTHGFTSSGRFDDTWRLALAESSWSSASPGGAKPLARCLLRAVWDGNANALLLFGGQSNSAPYHNDFWRLQGGAWTEIKADPRPSARHLYAADFDSAAKRLLLFGGRASSGHLNDLWAFDGSAWSQLEVAGEAPPPRSSHDAVFLADQRAFLIFGGAGEAEELADAWLLEST